MRTSSALLLSLLVATSLAACAPKIGPRPVLSPARVSVDGEGGQSAVWTRVQVHFKDAKPGAKHKELMDKLTEEVTFELAVEGQRDRITPSMIPSTIETAKTKDATWADRFAVDLLFFPAGLSGRPFQIFATDYYQDPGEDPVVLDLQAPESYGSLPKVTKVEIEPSDTKGEDLITIILDRDAPANLQAWHHVDGRLYRMDRRGSRVFVRQFRPRDARDHRVVMRHGDDWLSPPAGLTRRATEDDEEEE